MPSSWMAAKRARMHAPYTPAQLLLLPGHKLPGPEILDAAAEEWMYRGWNPDNVCPGCGLTRTVKDRCPGACRLEMIHLHDGLAFLIAGPCGWFKRNQAGTWELRVKVLPALDAPASRQPGRYLHGARVMRETGLTGPSPDALKRKRARQARTRARKTTR